ncbi:uncharacterized protein N7483_012524 [Penicillium malachiteum]|uniref:uncharacterized protein n=1 Tax=Penicillium malachiteum TaxID=1324776 RepID=UPI002547C939|nr:uncharacterized protein N7483_012524 [Penicillium malachiteum]KAJ5715343.1 hypothetical protein N7483_012524 [Penicillium malachiteum]
MANEMAGCLEILGESLRHSPSTTSAATSILASQSKNISNISKKGMLHSTPSNSANSGLTVPMHYTHTPRIDSTEAVCGGLVPSSQLLDRITDWVSKKQSAARAGDVVNIILDGHGNKDDGFMAGDNSLHRVVFANLISHFKPGVQVNFVPEFCYSGNFIDAVSKLNLASCYCVASADDKSKSWSHTRSVSGRVRNGRFTTALVQSLANTRSSSTSSTPWSVKDHEHFMVTQLNRNITPGEQITLPEFWSSNDLDPSLPLEDLFFRDMISFSSYGHSAAGRNARVEWPTTNPRIRLSLGETCHLSKGLVSGAVTKALMDEIAQCDTTIGYPPDIGVNDQMYMKDPDWRGMLRNLYWRFQRQYVVWEIYLILADRGFVEASALTLPMNLFSPSKATRRALSLLSLFSRITDDDHLACKGQIALQNIGWDLDFTWRVSVSSSPSQVFTLLTLTIGLRPSSFVPAANIKSYFLRSKIAGILAR